MSQFVFIWLCSAAFVILFYAIYRLVKKHIATPVLRDRDATLNTNLSAFRESYACDGIVTGANKSHNLSISELFEEMCINNPTPYENDPNIPKVLQDYKDLLQGRIEDPDGKHIPSEFLLGIRNSDYGVYLKSQIKVLRKSGKDVSWFKKEFKRFNQNDKEELFESDFFVELQKMGVSDNLIGAAVTDSRMENYNPDDWKQLAEKLKEYDEVYSDRAIVLFLEAIEDKETLLNEDKMEAFSNLLDLDLDEKLAAAYIEGDLSSEDLEEVADIMDKYSMSCEEALERFLNSKAATLKTLSLQDKYRRKVI